MNYLEIVHQSDTGTDVKLLVDQEEFIENLVLSRIKIRELSMTGDLPGVVKSSW